MAWSMITPKCTTADDLNKSGMGALIDMDYTKLRVAVAACVDGWPVAQEEQRSITTMVDEVVYDLRCRGPAWAHNATIFITQFPDVDSFIKSLAGERNIMRAMTRFPTRQTYACLFQNLLHTLDLGWEVQEPYPTVEARG